MNGKRIGIGLAGGGAAALCAASVAWACTYQPHMVAANTDSGPPSSQVRVSGQVAPSNRVVEIHWNGEAGPLLTSTSTDASGNFTAAVTVPADAAPEVYFLVGVVNHAAIARTTFEVTAVTPAAGAVPSRAAQGDVWNGYSSSTGEASLHGASLATTSDSGIPAAVVVATSLGTATVLGGALIMITTRRRRHAITGGAER